MAVPTITSVTPNTGVISGATSVTIEGANFEALQATGDVTFGGVVAQSYTSWNDTTIVCVTPAGLSYAPIVVTNDGGDSSTSGFFAASWESICTDGFMSTEFDWTDVSTDGIFTWGGFIFDGAGNTGRLRSIVCSKMGIHVGVGRFYF